jgi:hypothetical protein
MNTAATDWGIAGNSEQLGAFFAPQKTGLCGAPRSRAPAPSLRAVASETKFPQPLQSLAR